MTDDKLRALLEAATPGPWVFAPDRAIIADDGANIADVWQELCGVSVKTADANAKLIAAAPDLAAEVLRLRAKEAAGDKLAEAVRPIAEAAGTWMPYEETDETAGARLEHPKYGLERHAAFTFGDLFRTASAIAAWEAAK